MLIHTYKKHCSCSLQSQTVIKTNYLMICKRTKSYDEMKIYMEDEASQMSIINCKVESFLYEQEGMMLKFFYALWNIHNFDMLFISLMSYISDNITYVMLLNVKARTKCAYGIPVQIIGTFKFFWNEK